MPDEHDRSRIEVDRADRQVIQRGRRAAAARCDPGGYAGLPGQHFAFALALLLDELARQVRELHPAVRAHVLHGVRMLLG